MFLDEHKVAKVAAATAGGTDGTTDVECTALDLANAQGVVFHTSITTANAGNFIKVQQATGTGTADTWADLEGTKVTSGSSDEIVMVEVFRPLERYVRAVVVRGAATAVEPVWATVYGLRKVPYSNSTTGTSKAESHVSPAEGTA